MNVPHEADLPTFVPWDGADYYFWIQSQAGGRPERDELEYHWAILCPWLRCALARGRVLVASPSPPANAGERFDAGRVANDVRWLCSLCALFRPRRPTEFVHPGGEPCATCGCPRSMHATCRSHFDTGCGMAFAETDYMPDGSVGGASLLHCRCDGYRETPDGIPARVDARSG